METNSLYGASHLADSGVVNLTLVTIWNVSNNPNMNNANDLNMTHSTGLLKQAFFAIGRNWLLATLIFLTILNGLPWLAPFMMHQGWESAGNFIYALYSFLCHQLPQRSFFLFGDAPMISLETVHFYGPNSNNPLLLRQFVGNTAVGWKVAWSDRMVYMYGSPLIFSLLYWPFRSRIKPLPIWAFFLLLLPMAIDGTTHLVSDFMSGVGEGFRYTNGWLAILTNYAFPISFYRGDAFGSFNAWMRLLSGVLFGLSAVWLVYPRLRQ